MILVFGGAYQGKREYVISRFKLSEDDIYVCCDDDARMPKGNRVIYSLESWILALLKTESKVEALINEFADGLNGEIIICRDISCGIVPIDPVLRAWRETTGRTLAKLAQKSDEVVRLFCGIPTRLK